MATRATAPVRYSFGNLEDVLELPDLIAIQTESFQMVLGPWFAADLSRHQSDQGLLGKPAA